jgi:hypothetical protein
MVDEQGRQRIFFALPIRVADGEVGQERFADPVAIVDSGRNDWPVTRADLPIGILVRLVRGKPVVVATRVFIA